ncbi:hypothetical protein [Cupriavidus alkaliphilus]|uniref:hypothetical protein n=1 Tax=Cupriavidus alkaliphilus TaxID=942866 RepID=UPI0017E5B267|nr:hypothetical protein [Cupriavidus alkaliphilus]MBB2918329.1 hypothetical protein [Cupriavidus alkaliphilus]
MGVSVKVIDRGLVKFVKDQSKLAGNGVKVGIQADAGKEPGTGVDILDVAIFNEFGTEDIPARPFVRDFFDKNRTVLAMAMDRQANAVANGADASVAMDALGLWVEKHQKAHVQQSPGWATPNAPSTVRKKGSSTPLIDHGVMLGAIRYEKLR